MHRLHCGLPSSHFIFLLLHEASSRCQHRTTSGWLALHTYLQVEHPVFTLGKKARFLTLSCLVSVQLMSSVNPTAAVVDILDT